MTELDYIKATNKAHLLAVTSIFGHILDGEEYGINKDDFDNARKALSKLLAQSFDAVRIDDE